MPGGRRQGSVDFLLHRSHVGGWSKTWDHEVVKGHTEVPDTASLRNDYYRVLAHSQLRKVGVEAPSVLLTSCVS